jgi:hypothetical protein
MCNSFASSRVAYPYMRVGCFFKAMCVGCYGVDSKIMAGSVPFPVITGFWQICLCFLWYLFI